MDAPRGMTPGDNDEPMAQGKNYLLAIGIDDHEHVPKLRNAVRDVEAVAKLLAERYLFAPEDKQQTIVLRNDQASKRHIINALGQLRRQINTGGAPVDNLVVYFAGHGWFDQDVKCGYWIPPAAKYSKQEDYSGDYISNDDVVSRLRAIQTLHTVLIVDACFAGSLFREMRELAPNQEPAAKLYAVRSRWAITSGLNEPVEDGGLGEHSPFARYLLEALRRPGPLLVSDVAQCLKMAVGMNARQQPTAGRLFNTDDLGQGEFVFFPRPEDRAEKAWRAAKAINTPVAYDDFLDAHPASPHVPEAHAQMQALEQQQAEAEELAMFNKAKNRRSLSDLNNYLNKYDEGQYVDEARKLKNDIREEALRREEARRQLEASLKREAQEKAAEEAETARLAKLAAEQQRQANTEKAAEEKAAKAEAETARLAEQARQAAEKAQQRADEYRELYESFFADGRIDERERRSLTAKQRDAKLAAEQVREIEDAVEREWHAERAEVAQRERQRVHEEAETARLAELAAEQQRQANLKREAEEKAKAEKTRLAELAAEQQRQANLKKEAEEKAAEEAETARLAQIKKEAEAAAAQAEAEKTRLAELAEEQREKEQAAQLKAEAAEHERQAKETEEDATWQSAQQAGSEAAYFDYTRRYPYGWYVNQANEHIRRIHAEREAQAQQRRRDEAEHRFTQAKAQRSAELLRDFVARYPESPLMPQAQALLTELTKSTGPTTSTGTPEGGKANGPFTKQLLAQVGLGVAVLSAILLFTFREAIFGGSQRPGQSPPTQTDSVQQSGKQVAPADTTGPTTDNDTASGEENDWQGLGKSEKINLVVIDRFLKNTPGPLGPRGPHPARPTAREVPKSPEKRQCQLRAGRLPQCPETLPRGTGPGSQRTQAPGKNPGGGRIAKT